MSKSESPSSNSGSSVSDCSVTMRSGRLTGSFCFPADVRRLVAVVCEVDASRGTVPLLARESAGADVILEGTGV